jgi:DNA-nicking Smr family endonuclease
VKGKKKSSGASGVGTPPSARPAAASSKAARRDAEAHGPFAALRELRDQLAKESTESGPKKPAPGAPSPKTPTPRSTPRPPPKSGVSDAGRAGESADETLAFHRLMSGVTPLEGGHARVPRSQNAVAESNARQRHAEGQTAAERETEEVHAHLRALVEGATRFEVLDDGRRVEGRRVELPFDVVRKLRRGLIPVDAELDLHGLGSSEARARVESFVRDKRARGERCVLIVHGKGEHSPGGAGILRGEISAWLAEGAASEHVAAFTTAVGEDGGAGAVYVLLRR